jgi:hypothetical protein
MIGHEQVTNGYQASVERVGGEGRPLTARSAAAEAFIR